MTNIPVDIQTNPASRAKCQRFPNEMARHVDVYGVLFSVLFAFMFSLGNMSSVISVHLERGGRARSTASTARLGGAPCSAIYSSSKDRSSPATLDASGEQEDINAAQRTIAICHAMPDYRLSGEFAPGRF